MIDPPSFKDVFGTSEDSEEFNGFSKEEIKMASSQKSRRPRQKAKDSSSISVRSEIQRPSFLIGGAEDRPKTSISKPTTEIQAHKDSKQKNSESSTTARKSPCKSNMADLDVEATIKPVSTVDTQHHSRHSSDIGEPTEISSCLSNLERIMEAIAGHVGLLEPDAKHAEETHMSHTDDQVQQGGSQDGFSDEDFAHPNSDLAGNSISHGGKRILPEEFLDSESSKKQKLSEFSENFDCDQEPNQFQFYHLPSDLPPKWPVSEHIDQYFKKYFFSSGLDNKTYNEIQKDIGLPDGTFFEAPEVNASIANFKSLSTNKGIQIGDDILKKVQNHLMSSSVVMLKLWQALQDGESLSEEDIFGCIQRNIVLSGSAFSMLSQFRKNRFKRVLSKEYASVCSESYRDTEDTAKPSKNLFGDNLSEKILKISEENKLFKQASKFASDNCQFHGSKGFQPFRKSSRLFSQPVPHAQKAKAGSNPPSRRVVFRSKPKKGASNSKKNFTP